MNTLIGRLRKHWAAAVALGALSALVPLSASAVVLDDWNLNLSVANGEMATGNGGLLLAGLGDATDIDHVALLGVSTITQTVVGGVALGQPFAEEGVLGLTGYVKELDIFPTLFALGNAMSLYVTFDGLTGTLNGDGTITFDAGVGDIFLYLDDDTDGDPTTGNVLEIAEFDITNPSGGSDLDFFGGAGANATIDVTLEVISTIDAGLFTDTDGNDLGTIFLGLANVDALLNSNFPENPDNSGIDDETGNGVTIINVQNGGQLNVAIPEPGALSLVGLGLISLALWNRRKKRFV